MKALSVVKEAGDLLLSGRKTLEIRSWLPDSLPLIDLAIVQNNTRLSEDNNYDPNGQIILIVDVHSTRPWSPEDAENACSKWVEGYFAWELSNIRILKQPVAAEAKLKIYNLPISTSDLDVTPLITRKQAYD